GDQVAAADIDLVGESQRDRLAGDREVEVAVTSHDALDRRLEAGRVHADAVARPDDAGADGAGEASEVQVGAVDPLPRQAGRPRLHPRLVDLDGLEVLHQR